MSPNAQKQLPTGAAIGGETPDSVSVLLAGSDTGIREGLKQLLHRDGVSVIGEASDGIEAVRLAGDLRPQIAVLDLPPFPFGNTLEAIRRIRAVSPRTRVILLGGYSEHFYVVAALSARITGYVMKTRAAARLPYAIHEVRRGRIHLCPDVISGVVDRWRSESVFSVHLLSPLERDVLELIVQGSADQEICGILNATPDRVALCRARILQRVARFARSRN